jgi:hypothetical protein
MPSANQQSTSARPWVVLKFGGTSVATAARWKSIVALAKKRRDEGFRPVVVVSALSGVTNLLLNVLFVPQAWWALVPIALYAFGWAMMVPVVTLMVLDLVPDENRMKATAGEGYATATDLADWLVRTLKMPFRDAHHVTGRIVGLASRQGVALHELPLKAMQEVEPKITAEALRVLSVEASVKSRTSYGGTAPKNVLSQAKAWLKRLEKEQKLG